MPSKHSNNNKKNHPGVHAKVVPAAAFGTAHQGENNIEQGQSPSVRAAHHRGQNTFVAPARPAAPTRSAGVLLAKSTGATIASFFVRTQTTPGCTRLTLRQRSARGASHGKRMSRQPQRRVPAPAGLAVPTQLVAQDPALRSVVCDPLLPPPR